MMPRQKIKSPHHLILYLVILLAAFGMRVSIFDNGLPFASNVDATNFYMVVNDNRGLIDAQWRNDLLEGYPPAYLWLFARVSDIADITGNYNIHIDQQYYIANMRLISIFSNLITLAAIIASAQFLGGRTAGLIAGTVYAISAQVIELSIASLPDPTTTMFMSLSALVTIISLRKRSVILALIATIIALIAIAFKYPVAPILIMPAIFFLFDLWHRRVHALPTAAFALAMVLATAYYLLYINGGASFDIAETQNFKGNLFANILSPTQWQATLNIFFDVIGLPIIILSVVSLAYPFVFKRQRQLASEFWVMLLAAILMLAFVPLYLVRLESIRYVYPAVALFTVIFAVLQHDLTGWFKWAAIALIAIWGFIETQPFIARLSLPVTFAEAQFWVEENLSDESVIWVESLFMFRSLARYEAGYSGFNNYGLMYGASTNWLEVAPYLDYVYIASYDVPIWQRDTTRPSLDDLLLIKQIDNIGYDGPVIYIYDPYPPENLSNIALSDANNTLALRAYEIEQDNRTIQLNSYWQAPQTTPTVNYSYVLYLTTIDDPNTPIFQQDAALGYRPTSTWTDPDELLNGNILTLTISPDIAAGNYHLWLGIYYWETGIRLQLEDNTSSLFLGDITLP